MAFSQGRTIHWYQLQKQPGPRLLWRPFKSLDFNDEVSRIFYTGDNQILVVTAKPDLQIWRLDDHVIRHIDTKVLGNPVDFACQDSTCRSVALGFSTFLDVLRFDDDGGNSFPIMQRIYLDSPISNAFWGDIGDHVVLCVTTASSLEYILTSSIQRNGTCPGQLELRSWQQGVDDCRTISILEKRSNMISFVRSNGSVYTMEDVSGQALPKLVESQKSVSSADLLHVFPSLNSVYHVGHHGISQFDQNNVCEAFIPLLPKNELRFSYAQVVCRDPVRWFLRDDFGFAIYEVKGRNITYTQSWKCKDARFLDDLNIIVAYDNAEVKILGTETLEILDRLSLRGINDLAIKATDSGSIDLLVVHDGSRSCTKIIYEKAKFHTLQDSLSVPCEPIKFAQCSFLANDALFIGIKDSIAIWDPRETLEISRLLVDRSSGRLEPIINQYGDILIADRDILIFYSLDFLPKQGIAWVESSRINIGHDIVSMKWSDLREAFVVHSEGIHVFNCTLSTNLTDIWCQRLVWKASEMISQAMKCASNALLTLNVDKTANLSVDGVNIAIELLDRVPAELVNVDETSLFMRRIFDYAVRKTADSELDVYASIFLQFVDHKHSGLRVDPYLKYFFAFNSAAQGDLVKCSQLGDFSFALWIRDPSVLVEFAVANARYLFTNSKPVLSSIIYILTGHISVMKSLWKHTTAPSNHNRLSNFVQSWDTSDRVVEICIKNAYSALSKQDYEVSIMLFLLAGRYKDAVEICFRRKKDPSLGCLILRLGRIEGVPGISHDVVLLSIADLESCSLRLLLLKAVFPGDDLFSLYEVFLLLVIKSFSPICLTLLPKKDGHCCSLLTRFIRRQFAHFRETSLRMFWPC